MSINGVHSGLRLPLSIEATSEARCPTVRPLASTTYHFRLPARSLPLGKYVDIVNYLYFQRIKRERLEYKPLGKVVKAGGSLANSLRIQNAKALANFELRTPKALANFGLRTSKALANFGLRTPKALANFGLRTPKALANFGLRTQKR